MPSLELLDALTRLGATGLALIGIYGLVTGKVRVGWLVDRELKETRDERDAWKAMAQSGTPELKRLNDLLETAVKLLLNRRDNP